MKPKTSERTVVARMPKALLRKLDALAVQTGRSRSGVLRQLLRQAKAKDMRDIELDGEAHDDGGG